MLTVAGIIAVVVLLIVVVRKYSPAARHQPPSPAPDVTPTKKRRKGLAADYPVDLDSDPWKDIKRRVLERDRHMCRCCNGHAETVHHLSYDEATLNGESLKRLISVCNGCHYTIHFDDDGKKRRGRDVLAMAHQLMRDAKWRYDAM